MKVEINIPENIVNFLRASNENSIDENLQSDIWLDFIDSLSLSIFAEADKELINLG